MDRASIDLLTAVVVPQFDCFNSEQVVGEIRKIVLENMPHYCCPNRFHFVTQMPETTSGKIDYKQLQLDVDGRSSSHRNEMRSIASDPESVRERTMVNWQTSFERRYTERRVQSALQ